MTFFRNALFFVLAGFFFMAAPGCSTQKNALPNRLYHSINAKYNGYFNARENYREGLRRLSMAHIDNYDQVLHIFRYGNEQQASAVSTYMDVVYQKASLVIRRHSMNIRGVEYNRWIDESFYLIAKSHYFKRDYNLAVLTFEYIVRQYDSDTEYEAKAWIAKSYHQLGRYNDAGQTLEQLSRNQAEGVLSRDAERLYNLVYADHFIRQEDYANAAPYLMRGAEMTRNKRERTRLTFILAQVYQHAGDYGQAQQTYARVLRMNPSFDLAFQARISMAMAFDPSRGGAGDIEAELNRMLRDDKNRAYRDQIYYAMAQLYLRQGREEEAVAFLLKSTEVSEENRLQKGMSFKLLGEIHFERPAYLNASIYYDSAVAFIPPQHEVYPDVNNRKVVLSALASNIRTIEREDSLQRLAAMTEAERNAIVDKIIEDLREEERQARLVEQQMMRAAATVARTRLQGGAGAQEGGWYFYNTTTRSFGRTEFFSRFGDRPLEDLWRISNKTTSEFDMAMGDDDWEDLEEEPADKFDRQTYLRNIPVTPEDMERSNMRIANAYYNKSMVFKDQLADYPSAINSLEALTDRFPDSDQKLHAYYYLYNLYRELQNPSRAEIYKNRIITEFPESDFAQILGDPEYFDKLMARQQYARGLYDETYRSFLQGRYHDVIDLANQADTIDMAVDLRSQFAYIRALATGKLGRRSEFRQQLENVISGYDGKPVHQPATILLASLETPGGLAIEFEEEEEEEELATAALPGDFQSMFHFDENIIHFFVFVVPGGSADMAQIRGFINTFNTTNYPDSRLSASSIFLDDRRQIITVTNFANKVAGMEYFDKITDEDVLSGFPGDGFSAFIISVDNYPLFYQEKNLEEYLAFFQYYYVN